MNVKLEWYEQFVVIIIGITRFILSRLQGRKHKEWADTGLWVGLLKDIDATGAEDAVAKAYGRYWHMGINTMKKVVDVFPDMEVRHTTHPTGRLIVRTDDDPYRTYVLVYGSLPEYDVVGCIRGCDARRDEWVANPNNKGCAWFVPEKVLRGKARDESAQLKTGTEV